jgi:hypothetical protein
MSRDPRTVAAAAGPSRRAAPPRRTAASRSRGRDRSAPQRRARASSRDRHCGGLRRPVCGCSPLRKAGRQVDLIPIFGAQDHGDVPAEGPRAGRWQPRGWILRARGRDLPGRRAASGAHHAPRTRKGIVVLHEFAANADRLRGAATVDLEKHPRPSTCLSRRIVLTSRNGVLRTHGLHERDGSVGMPAPDLAHRQEQNLHIEPE